MFVTSDLSILLVTGITRILGNRITSRVLYSGSPSSPAWLRETSLQLSRDGTRHSSRIANSTRDSRRRSKKQRRGIQNFYFYRQHSTREFYRKTTSTPCS